MNEHFDEQPLAPIAAQHEAELTLGPGGMFALFLCLMLLCGFCFGLGYAFGHRTRPSLANPEADKAPLTPSSPAKKLAATASQPHPPHAVSPIPSATASASASPGQATSSTQWTVKPALPSQSDPAPATTALPGSKSNPPGSFLVQIAAVSHQEDADVLLGALRRRGYAVSARRDPADNLIHVRIGPFAARADAETMKNKLLNDGYNAQIQ